MPVDRVYWLSGLEPRDADARWSRVAASSHALAETVFDPVLTDDVLVIDDRDVRVRDQRLVEAGALTPANEVDLHAENTSAMTVDLVAAGLDPTAPATVHLDTDGDIELVLARGDERAALTLPDGIHHIDSPSAPESVTAFAAGVTRHIRWSASDSDLPVHYTVRDQHGALLCETTAVRCLVIDRTGRPPASVIVTASNLVGTSVAAEAEVDRRGR